jgi:hypothetical protein
MSDKRNPLMLATRSIAFPAATLFVGSLTLFLIRTCCQRLGFGGVIGFLPFILIALLLLICGIVFGIMWGVTALRLTKELPVDNRLKVLSYAYLGIALSLLELGVFYWMLLVYPASV